MTHVPILDREEGKAFQPQTLTIVYASPTVRIRQQVKVAGTSIALASLLLLGATTWLASWRIRRSLSASAEPGPAGCPGLDAELEAAASQGSRGDRGTASLDRIDDPDAGAAGVFLQTATRICGQRRARVEDAGGGAEVHPAVAAAASPKFGRVSRRLAGVAAGPGPAGATAAVDASAGAGRTVGAECAAARSLDVIDINSTCEEAVERIRSSGRVPQHRRSISRPTARFPSAPTPKTCNWCGRTCWRMPSATVPKDRRSRSRWLDDRDHAQVTFQDHGVGIAAAICPRFSSASIAETLLAPARPAALAWAWPSPKPWSKPTGAASLPRARPARAPA